MANLNFFYKEVADIPVKHLERVELVLVPADSNTPTEEYKKESSLFESSDTNSICKTPTGGISFLKKLEMAWTGMNFDPERQNIHQVFLDTMLTWYNVLAMLSKIFSPPENSNFIFPLFFGKIGQNPPGV